VAQAVGASQIARFEAAGRLPVGSVIAKDSFSVTETGGILLGPLFVMEKMPAGFNPASGDWRYTLIQPDGRIRCASSRVFIQSSFRVLSYVVCKRIQPSASGVYVRGPWGMRFSTFR